MKRELRDDRAMLLTPADWPLRPYLPVKRIRAPGEFPELGVIAEGVDSPFKVYLCDLFELPKLNLPDVPTQAYDTVDALLAAGWIVD